MVVRRSGPLHRLAAVGRVGVELAYLLAAALVLTPLIILTVGILMLLALVPVPSVRRAIGWVQRMLAGTLGDSFVLLESEIRNAAIVGHVHRDLQWLSRRCRRTVVIAHSQGAAIAHQLLRQGTSCPLPSILVTFGSGLNKLAEIRSVFKARRQFVAWAAVAAIVLCTVTLPSTISILGGQPISHLMALVLALLMAFMAGRLSQRLSPWVFMFALCTLMFGRSNLSSPEWHTVGVCWVSLVVFVGSVGLLRVAPEPQHFTLPQETMWFDYHASSDPVTNGPLFDEGVDFMDERLVYNTGSALTDHSAYWNNPEGFVWPVAFGM
jgi:hypothetical protein